MKLFKQYLLIVISASIAIYPVCTKADHTILTAPLLAQEKQLETQEIQKADVVANTTEDQKDTAFVRNAKYLAVPAALLLIIAGLCGLNYVWNRSITLAHEGGHALVALATGNTVTNFHVSKNLDGGGYISYEGNITPINDILIALAGPICGAATHFMWGKLGERVVSLNHGDEQKEMSLLARIGGGIYASIGAFTHLTQELTPHTCTLGATYGDLAGKTVFNDGAFIQDNAKKISPFLGTAYPYIIWAGLAAFAGYSTYCIYTMFKDLEKNT